MNPKLRGEDLLMDILSYARPHDSPTERAFCEKVLDSVPGMHADGFGNRWLTLGDVPVMWSCHVDTVSAKDGYRPIYVDDDGVIQLVNQKPGRSLGADDGIGVWIMLEMIRAGRPGTYVFHRGEERGCLGSGFIRETSPKLLEPFKAAIAFDRQGYKDVITHQAYGRTASDAFAQSFADEINSHDPLFMFRPDDGGIYTDTNTYADLIPECSNISVGYHGQHGPRETADLKFARRLRKAMLEFDATKLVFERDPTEDPWAGYGYGSGDWDYWKRSSGTRSSAFDVSETRWNAKLQGLSDLATSFPSLAARLMDEAGITEEDFVRIALEDNYGDDDYEDSPHYAMPPF